MLEMLSLAETAPDTFEAHNLPSPGGVVFGGQLLAQAIAATARVEPELAVKSMHTVFARGGSPDQPVELAVQRLHGGRSFASLEVSISQGTRLCTRSLLLLHRSDPDLISHQDPMPKVAPPDKCPPPASNGHGWEVRIADGADTSNPDAIGPPELRVWSRFDDVPPEPWASQALLGYASDGFLIGTAMRPHPGVGQALAHVTISTSVITQTLTFHDEFDAGSWLLLAHRSPHAGRGRSYGRADVFTADGRLVASFAQENMIRTFPSDRQPAPGKRSKH
jgi:acyl-CoA thioesterase II